ncbi:MAG: hypothetical protein ACRDYU_01740, partial [Actinomycetes bacterium]
LPMPAAELCDRPVTVEQVWGRPAIAELRDPFTGLTPTRYIEVRRRFLREHPGHALDGWPLPPIDFLQERQLTTR